MDKFTSLPYWQKFINRLALAQRSKELSTCSTNHLPCTIGIIHRLLREVTKHLPEKPVPCTRKLEYPRLRKRISVIMQYNIHGYALQYPRICKFIDKHFRSIDLRLFVSFPFVHQSHSPLCYFLTKRK